MAFDNFERMVELLEQLVENTNDTGTTEVTSTTTVDGDSYDYEQTVNQADSDVEDVGGQFFCTGEGRIVAPEASDEWGVMEFPFAARSLIVRHYHPIEISFVNPHQNGNPVVLEGSGSYEVGGDPPLLAPNMWYRTSERASVSKAEFRVEGL